MTEAERYANELIEEIENETYSMVKDEQSKIVAKIAVRRIIAANPQWIGNVVTPPRSVFFEQVLTAIDKN